MKRQNLDTELLRRRLKLKNISAELALRKKHPEADEFYTKIGLRPGQIRDQAARILSTGALAGTLLLSAHSAVPIPHQNTDSSVASYVSTNSPALLQMQIASGLQDILPPAGQWQLDPDQETKISDLLKNIYGIDARAELDGNRLPTSYGRMGAEQLLPRYPGDTAEQHEEYVNKGQTPGLGGWGYFAPSKEELTPLLSATEKYYVAVPIMYLPDWQQKVRYYVDWFKYRHVVVVNPANGKAIVAAVADAGPADWTGKHFGGSPAVLDYLGINYGAQNYPVVLFFLNNKDKEIPVGPLEYNVAINNEELVNKS